jgi:hypothetical protein
MYEIGQLSAQWTGAIRGPAFFAYANNYLIDVEFGVIVDAGSGISGPPRAWRAWDALLLLARTA